MIYILHYSNTGTTTNCLNLGSYNYLGFAQTTGPCADAAIEAIYDYGVGSNSARRDYGSGWSLMLLLCIVYRHVRCGTSTRETGS